VENVAKRLILTAGFDRALNVVGLGELLVREGHEIAGVLIVSPYDIRRLRGQMRQRGRAFPLQAVRRLTGRSPVGEGDPLAEFLRERDIAHRSLRAWATERGVPRVVCRDLNSKEAIRFVEGVEPDGVLYGGGGILRESFIEAAGGRVLNAHSGRAPEIRGMNACEWSLLLGIPTEVTIHFIDRGIDTGPVVERLPVYVRPGDTIEALRARCVTIGVDGLVRSARRIDAVPPPAPAPGERDLQCFVLAPALRELLEAGLQRGLGGAGSRESAAPDGR
jgi:folate-dependent phosphoribosylglycinamide formyltransferase PurN